MKQLRDFGDERQTAFCIYCGGDTGTRDHVPPKVFLDEPYPTNLPIVPACQGCNESFSRDEEYVACLLESAIAGSVSEDALQRQKVRRILQRSPMLASKLVQARYAAGGDIGFSVDVDRVRNVVLKLGRGHAAYELHDPRYDEPSSIGFAPLLLMSEEDCAAFETPADSQFWPEVGSRAMQRILTGYDVDTAGWIVVQPGRYRYLASAGPGVTVRVVLSEYLACEVVWA